MTNMLTIFNKKKQANYHNNKVHKIHLYKQGTTFVFDDKHLGLIAESFVCGATEFLDMMLEVLNIQNKKTPTIIFSAEPMGEYDVIVDLLEDLGTNAWYTYQGHELWLCGVLSAYFIKSPKNIYIKFQD